jgi:predicted extracellular nuclease
VENKLIFFLCLFLFPSLIIRAQQQTDDFSILFYNLENFFDYKDDSLTADENFTPEGELHWTYKRFEQKKLNISKAIIGVGGWTQPDIIIFCEIENRYVIDNLIKDTPLKKTSYNVIHKDSPDHRGIDVALIYNSKSFYPLNYQYFPVILKSKPVATREILYVKGIARGTDTLHIFGNHWSSRYSGLLETKELRDSAAQILKCQVDELFKLYKNPKIIVVGDFNENPGDEAIKEILKAGVLAGNIENEKMYNLASGWFKPNLGTLKYQSQWFLFDQIIVSGAVLSKGTGLIAQPADAKIVDLPFLMEDDNKFGGKKPFRTYYGYEYQGGFSDHLPVILKLKKSD